MATEIYDDNEPTKDPNPENRKDAIEYWKRWIPAAKTAAGQHWTDAEQAWAEYENTSRPMNRSGGSAYSNLESGSRIYWSSCKTMEPAFYSRTPHTTADREFGTEDLPALAACKIAESLGKHHTGTSRVTNSRFDETMMSAVQDFLHADKVCNQIIYEKRMMDEKVPVQPIPNREGGIEYVTEDGMPFIGETVQLDGQTFGYTGEQVVDPASQKIYPIHLLYNKTLHSPEAANQYDITEKAIYFFLTKDEAKERFPNKEIQWKSRKESTDSTATQTDTGDYIGEFVEGWECYDLENKKVRWYSDQCDEWLDEKDDPDQYYDFWPTTDYIIGSKPSKSLYPTPAYIQLRPLIEQLHLLSDRIYDLVDAIRPRALVDGDVDMISALDTIGSSMFVAAKNLTGIIEKGGLKNMVLFIPVKELVEALNTSIAIQQQFKSEFNEIFGLPDILRGISDPLDSEGTNAQNLQVAHDRFRYMKKQVATLASQTINKMIEISVQVYSPEKIAKIVGHEFWPENLKQAFIPGLEILKDPEQGVVRIDVDTDSLTFKDQRKERQQQEYVTNLVNPAMQNIAAMAKAGDFQFAAISLKLLTDTLEKTGDGKYVSDEVKSAIDALIKQVEEKMANPDPPPPDYEMLKIEQGNRELDIKEGEVQNNAQIEVMKIEQKNTKTELDGVKLQINTVLKQRDQDIETQIEARRLGQEDFKIQLNAQKNQMEAMVQEFMMHIEAQTLEVKKLQVQIQSWETMQEESRLAQQVSQEVPIAIINASKAEAPPETPAPPIINVNSPQISPSNINVPAAEPVVEPVNPLASLLDEL